MQGTSRRRRHIIAFVLALTSVGAAAPSPDAAACKQTVERFVSDLDSLMAENPRSLDRYNALFNWYFAPRVKSSSPAATTSKGSVVKCDVDQLVETAKHSKFLYEIGKPPQYRHARFKFRSTLTKVYFSVDDDTGTIFETGAWWVQPYP